jgi:DNA-binding NarL/FixJ family response regulator
MLHGEYPVAKNGRGRLILTTLQNKADAGGRVDTMRRKFQVLLIDEEGLLRDGLCAMINLEEGFAIAGVISGTTALHTVSVPADPPDLIVADFGAPAVRGLETVTVARSRWPSVGILVLTFQQDDAAIESALRAGVDGYLLKTDSRA